MPPPTHPPLRQISRSVYEGLSSSWHYTLTPDTTEQLSRSPPPSTRGTQRREAATADLQPRQKTPAGARKGAALEHKVTALSPFEERALLKSSPCPSLGPPFCACLTPPGPPSCTLARGLALKSGSLSAPNVINLPHSARLFFTYNGNGPSGSPLKSLTSQRAPVPGTWQQARGRTPQSRSFEKCVCVLVRAGIDK